MRIDEVGDYRSTVEPLLPLSEASVVQVQPGPPPTNLSVFSSDKISVLGVHHHAASIGIVVTKPDCFSFMWWDGQQDCMINGETARNTVLYSQGAHDGFHAVGGARRTMGIAVRRKDLIGTVAALGGIGPEDVLLNQTALELPAEAAARFRTGIDFCLKQSLEHGMHEAPGVDAKNQSEAIFGLLVDAYLCSTRKKLRKYRGDPPEKIVRLAEERFFASQGAPVSLADLCIAAGVSQATLYRAFQSVCDMPPLAYFHKRRLTDARRVLMKLPAKRGNVKQAAYSAGLTELGRFSVEYRQLFGETPLATLNRKNAEN
ncbi:helix-turn-helix domain-containing protein [Roseibium sp.]|uniref:AraC family transcriptional regulator n=1 Tax=Roseibium sp. TaxID=1936156 RepID=UPI003D11BDB1